MSLGFDCQTNVVHHRATLCDKCQRFAPLPLATGHPLPVWLPAVETNYAKLVSGLASTQWVSKSVELLSGQFVTWMGDHLLVGRAFQFAIRIDSIRCANRFVL